MSPYNSYHFNLLFLYHSIYVFIKHIFIVSLLRLHKIFRKFITHTQHKCIIPSDTPVIQTNP